jgi:hypothetical protein
VSSPASIGEFIRLETKSTIGGVMYRIIFLVNDERHLSGWLFATELELVCKLLQAVAQIKEIEFNQRVRSRYDA